MTNGFRSTLMGILTFSCLFLVGFKQHEEPAHSQKHPPVAEDKATPKPLDLRVPDREISFESSNTITEARKTVPVTYTADNLGKNRPVELLAKVILTQEQEAEKSRSADGAGIVINLRH